MEGFPFGQIPTQKEAELGSFSASLNNRVDEIVQAPATTGQGTPVSSNYNRPMTEQGDFQTTDSFMPVQIQRGVRDASPIKSENLLGDLPQAGLESYLLEQTLGNNNFELGIIRSHSLDTSLIFQNWIKKLTISLFRGERHAFY